MKIRLASLNIWNRNENWEKRKVLIAKELKEIDPDLVAFQEVKRDSDVNSAQEIASMLVGYQWIFYPEAEDYEKSSGIAILSKFPIENNYLLRLSRFMQDRLDSGNKLLGIIEIKIKNFSLFFGTTWLSMSSQAQNRTVQEIKYFLENQIGRGSKSAIVLAGDFNNETDDPIKIIEKIGRKGLLNITKDKTIITWPMSKKGFVDSWKKKHPGEKMTFKIIPRQIDYIFVENNHLVKILKVDKFANKADKDGLYPSDHLGLYCDLVIQDNEGSDLNND